MLLAKSSGSAAERSVTDECRNGAVIAAVCRLVINSPLINIAHIQKY
jgi:hypothetical protein